MILALRRRGNRVQEQGVTIEPRSTKARTLLDRLPFELTSAQKRVLNEIADDFRSGKPMNRLLQGDVGSGKTIVSVFAMLMAVESGFQTLIMAPTEILAEQHYRGISALFEGLGVNVVQLVGGQKKKVRASVQEEIASGRAHIVVGTHALFGGMTSKNESNLVYHKIGLIVIDEQHRFGVMQRAKLRSMAMDSHGEERLVPHILVMSATPIPRTLSMTLYGDLDVSIINELPKNRKPIRTKIIFENELRTYFDFIRAEVAKGRQAYIVYPLVEQSEKMELKSAVEHYEHLQTEIFGDLRVGLLHGQMLWYEKDDVMKAFYRREYDVLVATTVIEVGIDVPNATVMLIENAERFGLAQLHQLRGRVGRGAEQSYCFLATKDHFRYHIGKKPEELSAARATVLRLKTMEDTNDGFKIAEVDMTLRGPGDILGTRQSGMPEFRYTDLVSDGDIITMARREAFAVIEADPHLRKPEHQKLRASFLASYGSGHGFFDVA
jgi:ATP-dependent DNA helicase RecG